MVDFSFLGVKESKTKLPQKCCEKTQRVHVGYLYFLGAEPQIFWPEAPLGVA